LPVEAADQAIVPSSTTWARRETQPLRKRLFTQQAVALPAQPVRLELPRFKLASPIVPVGQGEDGAMATPAEFDQVGWYALGPTPGALGNAVLAGHLNNPRGQPAVFWDLDKLLPDDLIRVTDSHNVTWVFQVVETAAYPYDAAPLEEIFGFAPSAKLNLITCTGDWNQRARVYTERLVVKSTCVWKYSNGDTKT
jgi:sortase (surface protein transpeptidase)